MIIEGDGMAVLEEQEAESLTINLAPNQKMELLRKIWFDASSSAFMDFPVFCKDGVAFSNKLVLAAASPWMRSVLNYNVVVYKDVKKVKNVISTIIRKWHLRYYLQFEVLEENHDPFSVWRRCK